MQLPTVLRWLACLAVVASQNLKGSMEVVQDDAAPIQAGAAATHLDETKLHPPTTKQAMVAMVLVFAIPIVALVIMKKGKDNGWEGAFGTICCLITVLWVYTAVVAWTA
mmetsp:Transcript_55656/g.124197  ORF Transcript_55656/g.124197 Transcript_55656/m.124197 type:complete len:109 (+) Transcript_55656:84-410(+)